VPAIVDRGDMTVRVLIVDDHEPFRVWAEG
jgi:hypothetical protein